MYPKASRSRGEVLLDLYKAKVGFGQNQLWLLGFLVELLTFGGKNHSKKPNQTHPKSEGRKKFIDIGYLRKKIEPVVTHWHCANNII